MRILSVILIFAMTGGLAAGAAKNDFFALALAGDAAVRDGRYDDALAALRQAMKTYPKAPDLDLVYDLACRAYFGGENDNAALAYCSAAILKNPKNPAFYADRAFAAYRLGFRADARRDADAALGMGATRPALYGLKARLFWEEGETAEALTACRTALKLDAADENARFVCAALKRGRRGPEEPLPPSAVPKPRPPAAPPPASADAVPVPMPRPEVPVAVDCARPSGPPEKLICADARLKRLDADLVQLYRRSLAVAADEDAMRAAQSRWRERRDGCADKKCLAEVYAERRAELGLWTGD